MEHQLQFKLIPIQKHGPPARCSFPGRPLQDGTGPGLQVSRSRRPVSHPVCPQVALVWIMINFKVLLGSTGVPTGLCQHRNFSEIQTRFSCIVFHYRLDLVRPRNSDRWFYLQLDKVGKAMILSSRTCTAVSLLEACSSCPAGRLSLPGAARRGRDQK